MRIEMPLESSFLKQQEQLIVEEKKNVTPKSNQKTTLNKPLLQIHCTESIIKKRIQCLGKTESKTWRM